jgi:hypothetical protein
MKPFRLTLLFAVATGLCALVHAADRASVQAILIAASNERGETDRRLAPYEPTLRSILRFESYRFLGEDSAMLAVPEHGQLSLGSGHQLVVETERTDGRTLHLRVRWEQGGRTLMNTGLALRPGVPAVLGGPSGARGEVYAVILIGR